MGRRPKGYNVRLKSAFIEDLLDDLDMDRKELAMYANISYGYLCEIMGKNPRSIPSRKKIGQIAKVVGKKAHEIAEGLEPVQEKSTDQFVSELPYSLATKSEEDIPHEKKLNQINDFLQRNGFYVDCFYDMVELFRNVDKRYWERHAILEILAGMKDRLLTNK